MDVVSVAKRSWNLLWTNKYLWFFGFFAAGAGGAGGNPARRGAGPGSGEALPGWVWILLAVASLLAIVGLVLHVVSEAALIEGARRGRNEPFGIRAGFAFGLRYFWRLLGAKALAGAVALLGTGLILSPLGLGLLEVVPRWLGVGGTILLGLVAVPAALTGYFVYQYALRVVVLDGAPVLDAFRAAWSFVHGRVVPSLLLTVAAEASSLVAALALGVVLLPVALLGVGTWFAAGLVPAIAVSSVFFLPAAVLVMGAQGAFRSAVWTLGFLDARAA